jgi:predicted phosphoribosyltransferase
MAGADAAYLAKEKARQLELLRKRLVCAVPVAAPESLERMRPYTDEVVCLEAPEDFRAVGQFYRDFPQVEDAEVVALLARQGAPPAGGAFDRHQKRRDAVA